MINKRRFVFDTNVFVSAFLFSQSKPRQALDKAQDTGIILLSSAVFDELQEVLSRPKFNRYITLERRRELIDNLVETIEFINVTEQISECRDPKDNKYLELAVSGKAQCIMVMKICLFFTHLNRLIFYRFRNFWMKFNLFTHRFLHFNIDVSRYPTSLRSRGYCFLVLKPELQVLSPQIPLTQPKHQHLFYFA